MNSGTEEKRSRLGDFLKVFRDHAALASLEARFEAVHASRRLLGAAIAAVLALAAFVYLQIALVAALIALGLKLSQACLALAAVCGAGAVMTIRWAVRRAPGAGRPFEATRREMGETVEWIQKLFS